MQKVNLPFANHPIVQTVILIVMTSLLTGAMNDPCNDYTIRLDLEENIYIGHETTVALTMCRLEDAYKQRYDEIEVMLPDGFELTGPGPFTYDEGTHSLSVEGIVLPGGNLADPSCKTFTFRGIFSSTPLSDPCALFYFEAITALSRHPFCPDLETDVHAFPELYRINPGGGTLLLTDAISQGLLPDFPGGIASFRLEGTLVINSTGPGQTGYYLGPLSSGSQYGKIFMDEAAEIKVADGMTLVVQNELLTGCGIFWKGIHSESNAFIRLKGVQLNQAVAGLSVPAETELWITDSEFRDCFIGIDINPEGNLPVSTNRLRYIRENTFVSEAESFPDPWPGYTLPEDVDVSYAGIRLNNLDDFTYVAGSDDQTTDFRGLTNGIIKKRSNLAVNQAVFEDLLTNGIYSYNKTDVGESTAHRLYLYADYSLNGVTFSEMNMGIHGISGIYVIKGASFDKLMHGIEISLNRYHSTLENNDLTGIKHSGLFVANSTGAGQFHIEGNRIESKPGTDKMDLGIYIGNTGQFTSPSLVDRNEITGFEWVGLYLDHASNVTVSDNEIRTVHSFAKYSLALWNSRFNAIAGNYIKGRESGTPPFSNSGIVNLFSPFNAFENNTLDRLDDGIYIGGACTGTELHCNTMQWMNTGLHYAQYGITGSQYNTGNRWDRSSARLAYDALHEGPEDYYKLSQYVVPINGGIYTPVSVYPSEGWFLEHPINPPSCPDPPGDPRLTALDSFVTSSSFADMDFAEGLKWFLDFQLLQKHATAPEVLNGLSGARDYYDSLRSSPTGTLFAIDSALQHLMDDRVGLRREVARAEDSLAQCHEAYIDAEQAAAAEGFDPLDPAYADYLERRSSLSGWRLFLDSLYELSEDIRQSRLREVEQKLLSFAPANALEEQMKTVYSVWINQELQASEKLAVSDAQMLEHIADRCPLEDGQGVLLARSMLNVYSDTVRLWPESICQPPQFKRTGQVQKPSGPLIAYPNPADRLLHLRWDGDDEESEHSLRLVDLRGTVLSKRTCSGGECTLDVAGLPPGLYLLQLVSENGINRTACFIK